MVVDLSLLATIALVLAVGALGWKYIARPLAQGYNQAMNEEQAPQQLTAVALPWGEGVGPAPGRPGAVIPAEALPPVLTRTYVGKPDQLEVLRSVDAEALAKRGYFPTSQNYVEGRWSGTAWVLAFVAFIVLIGIFILVYMIAAKPAGTLTVIYERRIPAPTVPSRSVETPPMPAQVPPPGASVPVQGASDAARAPAVPAPPTKVCPDCAEQVLEAARICRFCRHTFVDEPVVAAPAAEATALGAAPVETEAPKPANGPAFGVADGAVVVPPGDWQEAIPPSGTYRLGGSVSELPILQNGRGHDFSLVAGPEGIELSGPSSDGGVLDATQYRWAACTDYPGVFVLVEADGRPVAAFRSEEPTRP